MSYDYKRLLPRIQNIINKYGVDLDVYRDVYTTEIGVQTYKETQLLTKIKGVLDNSKSSSLKAETENQFHQMELYILHILKIQIIQFNLEITS